MLNSLTVFVLYKYFLRYLIYVRVFKIEFSRLYGSYVLGSG